MDFKPLDSEIIKQYYVFTNKFPSYSDLNFTSLLSWSANTKYFLNERVLIVIYEDYSLNEMTLTGISKDGVGLITKLLDMRKQIPNTKIETLPGYVFEDKGIPGSLINSFSISENHTDYLYKPSKQLGLEGHDFAWQRRKLSHFRQMKYDYVVTKSSKINSDDLEVYRSSWTNWKKVSNSKELFAIQNYLSNFTIFINQIVFKITIENQIVAFAFCELLQKEEKDLIIHFFKSDTRYEGLSNFLFYSIAEYSKKFEVNYINFEQDLGEEGLRYYKRHLRPDMLLKKFCFI